MADLMFNEPLNDASIVQLQEASDGLASIGLRELLDADQRPSAIIDLHEPKGVVSPCYHNQAFNPIWDHCYHAREDENAKAFNGWAQTFPPSDDPFSTMDVFGQQQPSDNEGESSSEARTPLSVSV